MICSKKIKFSRSGKQSWSRSGSGLRTWNNYSFWSKPWSFSGSKSRSGSESRYRAKSWCKYRFWSESGANKA